jgi:hypothetical protein
MPGPGNEITEPAGWLLVARTDHRRPVVRPARARPPGRAQQAEPDRRAGEDTTQASHVRAAGALNQRKGSTHRLSSHVSSHAHVIACVIQSSRSPDHLRTTA